MFQEKRPSQENGKTKYPPGVPSTGCEQRLSKLELPEFSKIRELYYKYRNRLDSDSDGMISQQEVNEAFSDPTIRGEVAQFTAVLKSLYRDLVPLHNDKKRAFFLAPETRDVRGVSALDIEKYNALGAEGVNLTGYERHIVNKGSLILKRSELASTSPCLFGVWDRTRYESNAFGIDSIMQGLADDCHLLAPIASHISRGWMKLEDLKNMIAENRDRTFTVRFPNALQPVTVTMPSQSELILLASGGENGTWLPVLEKAYGEYIRKTYGTETFFKFFGAGRQTELDIINGGPTGRALQILSPAGSRTFTVGVSGVLSTPDVEAALERISSEKLPANAVTGKHRDKYESHPLPETHAYTILSYEKSSQKVILRNPWGYNPQPGSWKEPNMVAHPDGLIEISLNSFLRHFVELSWAEKNSRHLN